MKKQTFKIGDTVRIKPHKIGRCKEKGCAIMTEEMKKWIGWQTKITEIRYEDNYRTKLVTGFDFSPCMLEKVEKTKEVKPTEFREGDEIEMIAGCYPLLAGEKAMLAYNSFSGLNALKAGQAVCTCQHKWKLIKRKEEVDMKVCDCCDTIKESRPTPEGDEICPICGDRGMRDLEPPQPKECIHDKKLQIIRNYSHDYRDIKMNEFELEKMFINFVSELDEINN